MKNPVFCYKTGITDFGSLSTKQLADLIVAAMSEYQRRIDTFAVAAPAGTCSPFPVIAAPTKDEQNHVDVCLKLIKTSFVHAADRKEYRRIIKAYPEWAQRKRLPDDLTGSDIKRYLDFNS